MNALALRPETIERIKARMADAGLEEADIEESFVRGSGSGGQKINKTSSTVQLKHIPSATIVRCQETRSREANRWLAREMLAERILEARKSALAARIQEAEKIRRQKRRRSRRQKARMLADKKRNSEKKALRKPVDY
jgi:protein subunit release factor B